MSIENTTISDPREPDDQRSLTAVSGPDTQPRLASTLRATRFPLLTAREIIDRPEPPFLVRHILHSGSAAMMFGFYGEGKTTVAQDLAFSIAAGLPWHGHKVRRGPVVYIAAEDSAFLKRQILAWMQARGQSEYPDIFFITDAPQIAYGDEAALLARIREMRIPPVLVVIDTFSATFVGLDENTQKDDSKFNDAVNRIRRETGAAVLTLHHSGKNRETERGNTALGANCDLILKLEMTAVAPAASTPARSQHTPSRPQRASFAIDDMADGPTRTRTGSTITITCTKNRRGPRLAPISLALRPVDVGLVDEFGDPITACVLDDARPTERHTVLNDRDRALLERLAELAAQRGNGPIRSGLWRGDTKDTTFHRGRNSLLANGYVVDTAKGYELTAAGRAQLGGQEESPAA